MSTESQNDSNLHKGHRSRIRNRYKNAGIGSFEEHEVLEMLLFYVIPQKNTNPLAHKLLDKFISLKGVFSASIPDLMAVKGVGIATATFLNFIGELFNIYSSKEYTECTLKNTEERYTYFVNKLQNEVKKEVLLVVCLDNAMRVRRCSKLETGELETVHFKTQDLTNIILQSNCKNVILAHNHLTGEAVPSYEDIKNTKYIKNMLEKLGINLIDHIIVPNKQACSMAELKFF